MKQDYTMYIWKTDARTKRGERLVSTTVWTGRDEAAMERECKELAHLYPQSKGYRFEYNPAYKTVKSLMTGQDVVIAADTPRCCDPSSELYWSM